jgi:hypothetical protein
VDKVKQISFGRFRHRHHGIMRYSPLLAILGVVAMGKPLDPSNPPASAFRSERA